MGKAPTASTWRSPTASPATSPKPSRPGAEIAVVVGGGNIFRGLAGAAKGMDRATADYMGMLATVMNALAFQNALGAARRRRRACSRPFRCRPSARVTCAPRPCIYISKGRVVIFAAGTGNPFFTTDTTATLRGHRDELRRGRQGDPGRRRLFGRPEKGSQRQALRPADLFARFWRAISR